MTTLSSEIKTPQDAITELRRYFPELDEWSLIISQITICDGRSGCTGCTTEYEVKAFRVGTQYTDLPFCGNGESLGDAVSDLVDGRSSCE